MTAQWIDGRTAEAWGMVNRSVPLTELMDEADRLARTVSAFDAVALSESKRALDAMPASISGWRPSFEYGQLFKRRLPRKPIHEIACKVAVRANTTTRWVILR
jgi:enoyl-CoA hydratase/carnithine racemase